ncbi:hypothetical protein E5358_04810 [Palleniella muris]|uniref:Uncharacterized protein n=1 Tax=Palleniella muris TaxID=3038145 RepID=A0AC61QRH1_9BACT|nr:hypothetical protein [Palleniella muris]TGX82984.1 hypothetical protein E5358_04810 [Palleniella muris]
MDDYRILRDYLTKISGGRTITICQGIVKNVEGCLCEVEIGNIVIPDVRLRASETDDAGQLLITPKRGSAVTVGSLSGDLAQLVVLQVDHAETVVVNGGKLGGLVNIAQLTQKINELVKTFNSHTHDVTVSHPGGKFTTIKPGTEADEFNKDDYEDLKVTH